MRQCREIFLHQLGSALEELDGKKSNIHGARKQLKRARATLRLLRPTIGDELYQRENIAARDAARPLSLARDEEVMNGAIQGLGARFGPAASGLHLPHTNRKQSAPPLARIRTALKASMARAHAWSIDVDEWDSIATGLHKTYRRGRRALRGSRRERTTEDLHEWRKQTKYLWHQLQLLTPMAPGPVGELADEFHHLADYLGDEHDLAVLRTRATGQSTNLIDRRREELQDKAFALGERLYADKSQAFLHALHKYWTEWERRQSRDT
jgi:CHAD domain-containing protein